MEKTVYQYDLAGYFVGETSADESPLEPGVYHIPARCTEVAPPATWEDDKHPRWNGVAWMLSAKPEQPKEEDPVEKLRAFLAANPDVAAAISGGASV